MTIVLPVGGSGVWGAVSGGTATEEVEVVPHET